ncbi:MULTISPECIES: Hsp20/alpha crystallin family protein [Metallosphaera]|uniref:Hsp20/alpha crystallin family protein n=2 Tax=Sulfolobaceae TaxID=118883 RepID=UPI001F0579C8|nr:Hsp20/alpha crystallin family protein [Metallosphaera sedula]MCH1772138.1 Hsp20/alpha crystallin family protein [Metallosphaera sedula]MCP6727683.1 Hsp20/alpha crystallin family protein [Metallosphaera sedula]
MFGFGRKKDKKKQDESNEDTRPVDIENSGPAYSPFADFDEIFNQFLKMQEEMLKQLMENGEVRTYTRRVTVGPDGQPRVEEYVNGVPVSELKEKDVEPPEGDFEVVESGDKVIVTMEIPGVRKEDIQVSLKNKVKLLVEWNGKKREISLPGPVEPMSVKLNNGVLVCTFRKAYKDKVDKLQIE